MTAYPANTLVKAASVTAPGAGAVVAAITAPPEGVYQVVVNIFLTGTAETQLSNLRLRENGATVFDALPSLSTMNVRLVFEQVEVNPGGGNLDIVAIAAATAGAIYNVVLIATRIG